MWFWRPYAAGKPELVPLVMMRGGHLDVSVLGAFRVSAGGGLGQSGNRQLRHAAGGAMDLAIGAKRVLALTTHTTRGGRPKILERCTYPRPRARVVHRIHTDPAVLDVVPDGPAGVQVLSGTCC